MRKIDLFLVNGALGAGKTTFLKNLLNDARFKNARVIENEFANTSVDSAQLHGHDRDVETIAGLCICCSSGTELTDALKRLVKKSAAPVFIEATGMANSVKLIERLVVEDVFETFQLAGAWFVLDASEVAHGDLAKNLSENLAEMRIADAVLISKTDLVSAEILAQIEQKLRDEGIKNAQKITSERRGGKFRRSGAIEKLADLGETDVKTSDFNYTVVDTANVQHKKSDFRAAWPLLQIKYGLRRAKGNIVDQNNAVHVEATPAQILFSEVAPDDDLRKLVFIGENANKITKAKLINEIALFAETENAVDKLLEMYDEYKTVNKRKDELMSKLAKARVRGQNFDEIKRELKNQSDQLNQISDEMTFATPLVWMLYKYRAYQNEAQPILNMNHFRIHCSVPGYICTKRFDFTNAELSARNRKNFADADAYPDEELLIKALVGDDVVALAQDETFMKKWREREYFRDGERVAKWENDDNLKKLIISGREIQTLNEPHN